MPRNTPAVGKNWGIEVNLCNADGDVVYNEKRKPKKTKIKMTNGFFADGTPQDFYFGPELDRPGVFKGMAVILKERGHDITYTDTNGKVKELTAQCPGFKCPPEKPRCCCRRILYNEPDFTNGLSLLEIAAQKRGFSVLFLPKFHCELNFIEMCWGKAKRSYRLNLPSSKEEDVEKNMLAALESVTLVDMRKFARHARRFMDAYQKGLDGKWAAWASRKYPGHRTYPN